MKVTQLAYRLKLTPKQIRQITYDLNIKNSIIFMEKNLLALRIQKKLSLSSNPPSK